MPVPSPFKTKVVGLSFVQGYPHNIERLNEFADSGPLDAELRRNPQNPHDSNAVEVHVGVLGSGYSMIGHVPAKVAERIAPEMDRGTQWNVKIELIAIHPEHPFNPGVHLVLSRAENVGEPW